MSKVTGQQVAKPSPEEIALAAYFLWEKEGCIHGRHDEHWLQAEAQLLAARTQGGAAAKEPAPQPTLTSAITKVLAQQKRQIVRADGRTKTARATT